MKGDEERIREAGCEAYLSKPVAVAQFIKTQGSDRLYGPAIRADTAYRTNLYLNRAPSASMSPVVGCGKWIGKTYLPVPAISVRNFRPRPRGLLRIPVENRRPIGLATLQGVVHEVADHDRMLSARADIDAAMMGRMAGRRHEPKRIVELIAVVDEQRLAGFTRNKTCLA